MIGARSEELAKEAVSGLEVHLDLTMTMIRPLDGLRQVEYLKEFGDIYKPLEKRLKPVLANQEQWKWDKSYLWHEDRIVLPSDRIPALLKWTHESSGHVGRDAESQRIQFEFAEFAANSFAARIRCEFGLKFLVLRIRGEFALRIRRRRQNDHACAVSTPDEKLTLNCAMQYFFALDTMKTMMILLRLSR